MFVHPEVRVSRRRSARFVSNATVPSRPTPPPRPTHAANPNFPSTLATSLRRSRWCMNVAGRPVMAVSFVRGVRLASLDRVDRPEPPTSARKKTLTYRCRTTTFHSST
jgi:hypothetical protein